jgi:membrane associated rhomboid family serine protease
MVGMSIPEVPEQAPPSRLARLPTAVKALALLMIAVQALTVLAPAVWNGLFESFALSPARIDVWWGEGAWGDIAQAFIGHAFLHGGWLHLFFNLAILAMAGEVVGARYGDDGAGFARLIALFVISAVGGAILFVALNAGSSLPMVGASGAACGMFAGYLLGARGPDWKAALRDRVALQTGAYFLIANVALAALVRASGIFPIAWEAHLGGFVAGAIAYPLLLPKHRLVSGPWH